MPSDDELLTIQREAVDAAMHAANVRDGYGTNFSRESIIAGLRAIEAVVRADEREKNAQWRETAEVILSGVTVQGIPALDFIEAAIRSQTTQEDNRAN